MMGRRLYVGNLPYTTGEAELQELFSRAGTVESVRVMRDAATGRARGFAFVEMATDDEAQKAASELNQYQLGGRALTVNEARPKPEGGFGGGGGGFGGNRGGGGGGRRGPRWGADEELVERRPGHPADLRGGHARRGQRAPHGDRLRRTWPPCLRHAARRAAGDERTRPAQGARAEARRQEEKGIVGNSTRNVLPAPLLSSRSRLPPWISAIHRAIGSPRPAPAWCRAASS